MGELVGGLMGDCDKALSRHDGLTAIQSDPKTKNIRTPTPSH